MYHTDKPNISLPDPTPAAANAPMPFSSSQNVRELGGYMGENGIPLNTRQLLRGGDLSGLTQAEVNALESYGIRICIDLRNSREKSVPDPYDRRDELTYYAIPMAGDVGDVDLNGPADELLFRLYQGILKNYQAAIRDTMSIIAEASEGIIFHCTAGKDRTGVTAMLILKLCGVSDSQVIADYAASEKNNARQIEAQKKDLEKNQITGIPDDIFRSTPETMRKTLNYLKEQYGGAKAYLLSIGLTDTQLEAIRQKMLVNPTAE